MPKLQMKNGKNIFSEANETAVFNNGKIVSLRQTIPGVGEKLFSFTHSEDGKPFTLTDEEGISLHISLFKDSKIQSIEMPNGEIYTVNWDTDSSNNSVAANLNCGGNLIPPPEGNPCRDALVAISIAAGVCALTPGSVACWAATANAAYHKYRCYEATHLAMNSKHRNLRTYAMSKFKRKFLNGNKTAKKMKLLES